MFNKILSNHEIEKMFQRDYFVQLKITENFMVEKSNERIFSCTAFKRSFLQSRQLNNEFPLYFIIYTYCIIDLTEHVFTKIINPPMWGELRIQYLEKIKRRKEK